MHLEFLGLLDGLEQVLAAFDAQLLDFVAVQQNVNFEIALHLLRKYFFGFGYFGVEELVVLEVLVAHVVLDLLLDGLNTLHAG